MKRETLNNAESIGETMPESPVVELFLAPERAGEVWPEQIANNQSFLEQLEAHNELNENINEVIDKLPKPDISLEDAVEQGLLNEEQVEKTYDSFSDLLESGKDYNRLALYMPFEFLPDIRWTPKTESLGQSASRFREAYMKAWQSLLMTHDVRANFVDGDVMDVQTRTEDLPRVVKAAHLIPELVEKGFIEPYYALSLIKGSEDQILKESVADTIPVLIDMGFINEEDLKILEKSDGALAKKIGDVLHGKPEEEKIEALSPAELQAALAKEFKKIDSKKYTGITKKRAEWLKQKARGEIIEAHEKSMSVSLAEGSVTDKDLAEFLEPKASVANQQVLIGGIRRAIENNPEKAEVLYDRYKGNLIALWGKDSPETKDALIKTFCRLRKLNLVDDLQLAELGINIPNLAGPFSENLQFMSEEMKEVKNAVASIETEPELSKLIYPVALVFGSRLKGYGMPGADVDVGVFIRPEVSVEDRPKIQTLLKQIFSGTKTNGEVVEFWLQEKEGNLEVRESDEPNPLLGENYWTHILFGAVWEGDKNAIRELREKLLIPYMYDTDKIIHERDARGLYLEEIERDALQYRLMHKGYERFFPAYGGIKTPHAKSIDNKSMFWDSGYRQLATRLFASRVFLPKIEK